MAIKNQKERCGTFIHSSDELNVGIDYTIDKSRPLVIAHPAAGNHYHASMSFIEEFDHPFIQLVIDLFPYFPDTWPGTVTTHGNFMKYQRINDTVEGYPVFRVCDNKQPHWQVQVTSDAEAYLNSIPLVDILYLDWIDWIKMGKDNGDKQIQSILTHVTKFVRKGGLIILDHKHDLTRMYCFNEIGTESLAVNQSSGSVLNYSGELEWLGDNSTSEFTAYSASMYVVTGNEENDIIDLTAFQEWIGGMVPEFAQSLQQINSAIEAGRNQFDHVDAYTWDMWNDNYIQKLTDDIIEVDYPSPVPAMCTWKLKDYQKFLNWVKNNPQLTAKSQESRSYAKENHSHMVNIIHGDIIQLSPLLFRENSLVAVRKSLGQKILNRCPWWTENIVQLQSSRPWMENPIPSLLWSGDDVTIKLIGGIMDLCYSKFLQKFPDSNKIPNSLEIITIANGNGELEELLQGFDNFLLRSKFPKKVNLELTVVHLDSGDYADGNLPNNWFRN
jgi:hypothetical protein